MKSSTLFATALIATLSSAVKMQSQTAVELEAAAHLNTEAQFEINATVQNEINAVATEKIGCDYQWANSSTYGFDDPDNIRMDYSVDRLGRRVDAYLTRFGTNLSATDLNWLVKDLNLSTVENQLYKDFWTENGA